MLGCGHGGHAVPAVRSSQQKGIHAAHETCGTARHHSTQSVHAQLQQRVGAMCLCPPSALQPHMAPATLVAITLRSEAGTGVVRCGATATNEHTCEHYKCPATQSC